MMQRCFATMLATASPPTEPTPASATRRSDVERPRAVARSGSASAASDSANAIRPHMRPQPATGIFVVSCTIFAKGESHTAAQFTVSPTAQNVVPPARVTRSSPHWNNAQSEATPANATRATRRARGSGLGVVVMRTDGLPNPGDTGNQAYKGASG